MEVTLIAGETGSCKKINVSQSGYERGGKALARALIKKNRFDPGRSMLNRWWYLVWLWLKEDKPEVIEHSGLSLGLF